MMSESVRPSLTRHAINANRVLPVDSDSLSNTISTNALNVVVLPVPSCNSPALSSRLIFSYASPNTNRIAMKKFDLPDPFLPTTTLCRGLNSSTAGWSLYDLKPWMVMVLMYMTTRG